MCLELNQRLQGTRRRAPSDQAGRVKAQAICTRVAWQPRDARDQSAKCMADRGACGSVAPRQGLPVPVVVLVR